MRSILLVVLLVVGSEGSLHDACESEADTAGAITTDADWILDVDTGDDTKRQQETNPDAVDPTAVDPTAKDPTGKAELHEINELDVKTGKPKSDAIDDIMHILGKDMDMLKKTLVAFDFDLTLRDDGPGGKSVLRLGDRTHVLLQWFSDNRVPVVIMSARTPTPSNWQYMFEQASVDLDIVQHLNRHLDEFVDKDTPLPTRVQHACGIPKEVDAACQIVTVPGVGTTTKYASGDGILLTGANNKPYVIVDYIDAHAPLVQQVAFIDDFVGNVYDVGELLVQKTSIHKYHGFWLNPEDHGSKFTPEILDNFIANSQALQSCLDNKALSWSECEEKVKLTWCDFTVEGVLGDNSFGPFQPRNKAKLYALRELHHFPKTIEESSHWSERVREGESEFQQIFDFQRRCRDKQKEAYDKLLAPKGDCCSNQKCMSGKLNRKELAEGARGSCDICSHTCCTGLEAEEKILIIPRNGRAGEDHGCAKPSP